jgi:hypothetical protein
MRHMSPPGLLYLAGWGLNNFCETCMEAVRRDRVGGCAACNTTCTHQWSTWYRLRLTTAVTIVPVTHLHRLAEVMSETTANGTGAVPGTAQTTTTGKWLV